ncbi:hypothetical protein NMG60_11000856 [Bertholletia excelsa]
MSHSVEEDKDENLEFKWGKKRGLGGRKKEVQFYESFRYDGIDYTLHDCVYMHKEGEPEPYVGKLIKIWEHTGITKKVKVHWFFHPSEIVNWLGEEKVLQNEIFLASGEGAGVANVNSLEAIAGKCNVVCISKDSRNSQPSEQELEMADYVFYRTFDVNHCTISDRIDDKVAGLEVKSIFNKKESEKTSEVSELESDIKEEHFTRNQAPQPSEQKPPHEFKTAAKVGSSNQLMAEENAVAEVASIGNITPVSTAAVDSSEVAMSNGQKRTVSGDKMTKIRNDSGRDDLKMSKVPHDNIGVDEVKFIKESGNMESRLSKKPIADGSVKSTDNCNMDGVKKCTIHGNDEKTVATITRSFERKTKARSGKDLEGDGALEDRPSKKARVNGSVKLSENKNNNHLQSVSCKSDRNDAKDLAATIISATKVKSKVSSIEPGTGIKLKTDEKKAKLSKDKLHKASAGDSLDLDRKNEVGAFEVTRRPDDERSRWFRALPWDERMKNAVEQGTLIQLLNLDPEYTSGEVEDIIWHAFKENCTAKMVQHTAISSPHSGQAFIILKSKMAAERIVRELEDKCLMLSNGRPLVGAFAPAINISRKHSRFSGHLFMEKNKQQMLRDKKEAVSTSHCSQPNTIEYEMAMEWCLLQARSDCCWKQLYRQQREELRKLKANLKSK